MASEMSVFDICFEKLIGHEGGFTKFSGDRGNWTSGVIGRGELRGTKYGISSMSYPTLDIENLTLDAAKAIYERDFWDKLRCNDLPPAMAYLVFDTAVNCGPGRAANWLQMAIDVSVDGAIGPKTIAAAQAMGNSAGGVPKFISEFLSRRMLHHVSSTGWEKFHLGWCRRMFNLPLEALQIEIKAAG